MQQHDQFVCGVKALYKPLTFNISNIAGAWDLQLAQVVDANRVVLQGANVPEISRCVQR